GKSQLHQIHDPILSQVFLGNEEAESGLQLQFLGAIVFLATPLPTISLTVILGLDMGDVNRWFPELHAVLEIPPEPHRPIRLPHKSFSDFLLSPKNGGISKNYINASETYAMLAAQCIKRMEAGLRLEICEIGRPDVLRGQIDEKIMDRHIPANLQYAYLYWVYHLQQSGGSLGDEVRLFLNIHLLHWLEVLALLGKVLNYASYGCWSLIRIRMAAETCWTCLSSPFPSISFKMVRSASSATRHILNCPSVRDFFAGLLFSELCLARDTGRDFRCNGSCCT
ncbi:hypothetical protein MCOR34_011874, partial [Pyricularia oryzae]